MIDICIKKTSEKEAQDIESPLGDIEEEEKVSNRDDEDLGEITYEKGDSGMFEENEEEGDEDDDKIKKKKKMSSRRKKVKKDGEESDGDNKDFGVVCRFLV